MITVRDLSVEIEGRTILEKLSFDIHNNEIVGVAGESGSGKSMTALSIMGLLPENARIVSGSILCDGVELTTLTEKEYRKYRGNDISMIFQEPMTSLNPVMKIGKQVSEVLEIHTDMNKSEIKERAMAGLESAGLKDVEKLWNQYPHQLSGGMRQRVMIAMATMLSPKLLIADEPTTALDVTVQKQILKLIRNIADSLGASVLFVTHDLNLLRGFCNRVLIMNEGKIIESGKVEEVFYHPKEEYTKKLIASIPDRNHPKRRKEE